MWRRWLAYVSLFIHLLISRLVCILLFNILRHSQRVTQCIVTWLSKGYTKWCWFVCNLCCLIFKQTNNGVHPVTMICWKVNTVLAVELFHFVQRRIRIIPIVGKGTWITQCDSVVITGIKGPNNGTSVTIWNLFSGTLCVFFRSLRTTKRSYFVCERAKRERTRSERGREAREDANIKQREEEKKTEEKRWCKIRKEES